MPCWVAPTLAAEIWHIPLADLMRRIASGEVPSRNEDGFLFVDVAPYGPRVERPNRPAAERPPTFPALEEDDAVIAQEPTVLVTDAEATMLLVSSADESEMGPPDETASANLGDWRTARRRAARTRLPPPPPRRLSA